MRYEDCSVTYALSLECKRLVFKWIESKGKGNKHKNSSCPSKFCLSLPLKLSLDTLLISNSLPLSSNLFLCKTTNMPLPDHAITLNGGCNCRSIRYRIHVPARLERPLHPFMLAFIKDPSTGEKWKLEDAEADPNFIRVPTIVTCHCNDCRRSTGSVLPCAITVPVQIMEVSVEPDAGFVDGLRPEDSNTRDETEEDVNCRTWQPCLDAFSIKPKTPKDDQGPLTFYDSSIGRRRYFCRICGTPLGYISYDKVPKDWPMMLQVWLGNMDRASLDSEGFRPEHQVQFDKGVKWIQDFSMHGLGSSETGVLNHPWINMNVVRE